MSEALRLTVFALLGAGCAGSNSGACPVKPHAVVEAAPIGYVVEWKAGDDWARYDAICRNRTPDSIIMDVALVRGVGRAHLGASLRRALEASAFREIELDAWSLTYDCGTSASFAVWLNAKKNVCKLDRAIALVGQALAQHGADDRVVVRHGLWDAPAL